MRFSRKLVSSLGQLHRDAAFWLDCLLAGSSALDMENIQLSRCLISVLIRPTEVRLWLLPFRLLLLRGHYVDTTQYYRAVTVVTIPPLTFPLLVFMPGGTRRSELISKALAAIYDQSQPNSGFGACVLGRSVDHREEIGYQGRHVGGKTFVVSIGTRQGASHGQYWSVPATSCLVSLSCSLP